MSSGCSREKPVDIIDLDRYMRVSVMPSIPNSRVQRCGDLVVDAGGVQRMPSVRSSSGDGSYLRSPPIRAPAYHKRFSHDSGVSDGSCVKRRSRRYKHLHCTESNESSQEHSHRYEQSSAMADFRVNCEQALLEQQKQISRLAELCEKLLQPNTKREAVLNSPRGRNKSCSKEENSTSKKINIKSKQVEVKHIATDSSDTSSSSRNSGDVKLKEHKSDSCKTYKIMMQRLDDLSRVLTNRRPQTAAPLCPSSVLVCNKIVSTEPEKFEKTNSPIVRNVTMSRRREECRTSNLGKSGGNKNVLGISHAQTLNIAPVLNERSNVLTERVVRSSSSTSDLHSQYHLDDPIRFHEEAKLLQTLYATKHQANASHTATTTAADSLQRGASLCALCRMYWRAIRNRLSQTFGTYA